MKKITKLFICILALCMLLPAIASCNKEPNDAHYQTPPQETTKAPASTDKNNNGANPDDDDIVDDDDDDDDEDDDEEDEEDEEDVEETTPADPDAGIEKPEKIDMNGYTYRAYVRKYAGSDELDAQMSNGNNRFYCIDFWVEENEREQDAISYAVYQRNSLIESEYNCKIRQVSSNGSQIEHLTAAYANGDGYDLTIITAKPAAQAATRNLLRNIKDMRYVDLTNPSFDQNSINELSVGNKLYFLSGDMNVSTLEIAGLSVVNMEFYEKLQDSIIELFDEDPTYANVYNLVNSQKWTIETMMKIATMANVDFDTSDGSDLSVIDKGDTIGYHQYFYSTLWYFYSSGGRITAKNEEGVPELTIQTPKNQTLADYLYDHLNHVISVPWIPHANSATLNSNFLTGKVLFMDCALFEVRMEIYPNAEFEYGVLPCPLYEEGGEYHSVAYFNNWAHLWAIPSMTANEEYAERMLQIMAVYSSLKDSTMHAYYDRTVYLNAAPDNGSRQVMDIIRQSIVYDIALLYDWGGLEKMLENLAKNNSNPYGPAVSGIQTNVLPKIEETVELLKNPAMATN